MTRPNITPDPWKANGFHIIAKDKTIVAAVSWEDNVKGRQDANAQAIAAVPALLEALEGALLFIAATPHDPALLHRTQAALTKAGYKF